MVENEPLLTIQDLSVVYDNGKGIFDFTLRFSKGHFVALVGSNGAGKSTLMNTISGIQQPTRGTVEFNDHYINAQNPYNVLGFSPQSQVIDWYLSVLDNVLLGPLLAGVPSRQAKNLALSALELVGLKDKIHFSVDQLSGGQQQRVQIARAVAHNPSFYLLDEPTTGLDAESAEAFLQYLKKKTEEKECAVLISSHDLDLLENYCHDLIYMDDGQVVYHGPISEFLTSSVSFQRYEIEYKGELSEQVLVDLEKIALAVHQYNPLVIDIKTEKSLAAIISIVEKSASLLNIKSERLSLREKYLNMKGRG